MITEELATLFIILSYIVGFIAGLFVGAKYQRDKRTNNTQGTAARPAAADGKIRHEGKERSIIAVIIALVVVSSVIVFDHFKGPSFPDVFYCLNDGGAQITRMCTGRFPP
jgi:hypothetical protein